MKALTWILMGTMILVSFASAQEKPSGRQELSGTIKEVSINVRRVTIETSQRQERIVSVEPETRIHCQSTRRKDRRPQARASDSSGLTQRKQQGNFDRGDLSDFPVATRFRSKPGNLEKVSKLSAAQSSDHAGLSFPWSSLAIAAIAAGTVLLATSRRFVCESLCSEVPIGAVSPQAAIYFPL